MAYALPTLSWVNHVDASGAIITASSTAGDLSASNLADTIIGKRWRTTVLTAHVDIDWGADKTVGVLALRFPRDTTFPTSGSITHQLDADGGTAGAGAAYDSGAISIGAADGYGYHVHVLATAVSARYWRFTFSGVTGLPYIDVGRAWAGEAWSPTYGVSFSDEDEWEDLSAVSIAERSGSEYVDERPRRRRRAFELDALSISEGDDLREMGRIVGVSRQILFVFDPTAPAKHTILGRMIKTTPLLHKDISLQGKAFELRESP